jgi:hypothetical protein
MVIPAIQSFTHRLHACVSAWWTRYASCTRRVRAPISSASSSRSGDGARRRTTACRGRSRRCILGLQCHLHLPSVDRVSSLDGARGMRISTVQRPGVCKPPQARAVRPNHAVMVRWMLLMLAVCRCVLSHRRVECARSAFCVQAPVRRTSEGALALASSQPKNRHHGKRSDVGRYALNATTSSSSAMGRVNRFYPGLMCASGLKTQLRLSAAQLDIVWEFRG